MTNNTEMDKLIENLQQVAQKREEFAGYLHRTAQALQQSNSEGEKASGKLSLGQEIQDLEIASENLAQGRFRLMVLGDMKHGKSTLLNVLLGKDLLPRAVNPCTAILTILQFGTEEKVTVYFKDNHSEIFTFEEFKQRYTINPEEEKKFEESQEPAFPDVSHAVVEYPLNLLENGVEIVDTPGLNDTDERNQLTLGQISKCHAILFVLNASKPCTMEERRYLENFLKGKGLTIFFLINRWDEISRMALDPDDPSEIEKAETAQRQVFKANLSEYCQIDNKNLYDRRVFETSGLNALRRRQKGQPLDGTGLPEFINTLEEFLVKERAIAEFRQTRTLMRQTYQQVHQAVAVRIPLLDRSVAELKQQIKSVEPEFEQLEKIQNKLHVEIATIKEKCSNTLAESIYKNISGWSETFEADFKPYMPDIKTFQFLLGGQRKKFEQQMKENFNKYVNDKLSQWNQTSNRDIKDAFSQLAISASQYGAAYGSITDAISGKLGANINFSTTENPEDRYPGWARFATGTVAILLGDYAGAVGAGFGTLNWKGLLINIASVIGVNAILIGGFGVALGPIGAAIIAGTSGTIQMELMRRKFIKLTRDELKKILPNVARDQSTVVYQEVNKLFDNYGSEVLKRISEDIQSRKAELSRLVEQKENGEFQRDAEIKRLKTLEDKVYHEWQGLESVYEQILNAQG
jgi:small GTP-binding protein